MIARRRGPALHGEVGPALDDGAPAGPERRAAGLARARRRAVGAQLRPDELAFAELLVGRAGLALANAQLVNRLRATQRRLDGILGALAEAVTVQDKDGRVEYANQAAARLLGLPACTRC